MTSKAQNDLKTQCCTGAGTGNVPYVRTVPEVMRYPSDAENLGQVF